MAVVAEHTDHAGGMRTQLFVRCKRIRPRQVARLLRQGGETGRIARPVRRRRHAQHHRQRILKRHVVRPRARVCFANKLRSAIHDGNLLAFELDRPALCLL